MADHVRPSEDLLVKPPQPVDAGYHVSLSHTQRNASVSLSDRFHVRTEAFSTDDNVDSFRFSPLRGVSHHLSQTRHFPMYTHNLIWEIMHRAPAKVDGDKGAGTWEASCNRVIRGMFESFLLWRVKKIWWSMTNLMVADIRLMAKKL